MLVAKLLYRDICDGKISWDAQLPEPFVNRWKVWQSSLTEEITVPRPLAPYRVAVTAIELHSFGDASSQEVCAAVYVVVYQGDEVTQGLVCAKSRIATRNLTIPRLELVAGHMTVNLVSNVARVLSDFQVETHCWLDSTVALFWIRGKGEYRQFVANRVQKVQQHEKVVWHHVPNHLWREGSTWLSNRSEWPADVALEATAETRAETKVKREILAVTSVERDEFDQLLDRYDLFKVLRIVAWIQRFISNCRAKPGERASSPLVTEEIQRTKSWWIKRAQLVARQDSRFEADQLHLNLQPNDEGILECRGRIHGEFPIYLPDNHPFTSSLVPQAHVLTLLGGVGMTMAKIREHHWVSRLRQLVKKIRSKCQSCKRFQTKAFQTPPPGKRPSSRTQGKVPFQVLGERKEIIPGDVRM